MNVLTMILGAGLIVAGIHSHDPVGTLAGGLAYMAGIHWPTRRGMARKPNAPKSF